MKQVKVNHCKTGDIVYDDIKNKDGTVIISAGTILSLYHFCILRGLGQKYIPICTDEKEAKELFNLSISHRKNGDRIRRFSHKFVTELLSENEKVRKIYNDLHPLVKTHSQNVASLTAMLLGCTNYNMLGSGKNIIAGALLHDIGKEDIDQNILYAPRKLTTKEMNIVKLHSSLGYSRLNQLGFNKTICDIALMHHETFSGNGYPNQLKEFEIPLYADIVHIADIYDAICSKRVYKSAIERREARNIIENQRYQFRPDTFDLFMTNMPLYFVCDLVLVEDRIYEVIGYSDLNVPILRELVSQEDVLLSEIKDSQIQLVDL